MSWSFQRTDAQPPRAVRWCEQAMGEHKQICYPPKMAIPDYQTCAFPSSAICRMEQSTRYAMPKRAMTTFSRRMERAELLFSGQQGIFKNRIGWARTYLKYMKAALLKSPKRAVFKIARERPADSGIQPDQDRCWNDL